MAAGRADEHATLGHLVLHARRQLAGGLAGRAIVDELDARHQAPAAHVADRFVAFGQRAKLRAQRLADRRRVCDEVLVLEHVQDRQGRRARDRVAAEGREEGRPRAEPVHDLGPGDDRGDRVAVAHRLSEGDDVGGHAPAREAPQLARPAIAGLHLVGDEQCPGVVRGGDDLAHHRGLGHEDAVRGEGRVDEERRRTSTALGQARDRLGDLGPSHGGRVGRIGVAAAVGVRAPGRPRRERAARRVAIRRWRSRRRHR